MKLSSYYPVLTVNNVAESVAFYERHFGFEKGFDSGWYVHLVHPENPTVNLAIMESSHESLPIGHQNTVQGVLLNFETEEVDAIYEKMQTSGVDILLPLKDEEWGQRHFIMRDPAGVMIDVIRPIPASADFSAQYSEGAAPT